MSRPCMVVGRHGRVSHRCHHCCRCVAASDASFIRCVLSQSTLRRCAVGFDRFGQGVAPSCWHSLHSMCFPEHHPGRSKEGHICYHPLWLTRMNMHPLSEQVLCHRLCAFLLSSSPKETRRAIKDKKELMLLRHVLDLTVVHEDNITKFLGSHSREAGSRRCWLCLLADLTLLHHILIHTVDALR